MTRPGLDVWRVALMLGLAAGCTPEPPPPSPDQVLAAEMLALPPSDVQGAIDRATRIQDPVERGLVIELWIRQNRGKVDLTQASRICPLTGPHREDVCVRHLSALHLADP